MYGALRYFRVLMIKKGMKSENHIKNFFRYLTPEQKCHYALLKLAEEAYL